MQIYMYICNTFIHIGRVHLARRETREPSAARGPTREREARSASAGRALPGTPSHLLRVSGQRFKVSG